MHPKHISSDSTVFIQNTYIFSLKRNICIVVAVFLVGDEPVLAETASLLFLPGYTLLIRIFVYKKTP